MTTHGRPADGQHRADARAGARAPRARALCSHGDTMDAGHHPFAALLVAADHETVLLEQGNVDSVNHAEAVLAREAAKRWAPRALSRARS